MTRPVAATPAASTTTAAAAQLCVKVQSDAASIHRGQAAQWTVTAWAVNGTVQNAVLKLTATPASQAPKFTFGCPKNGTSSCALGTVDPNSAAMQFKAQVAVPASAASVSSVKLTATGTSPQLTKDPAAATTISVTAAPGSPPASSPPASASSPVRTPGVGVLAPSSNVTSTFPAGSLPYLSGTGPATLSPGGNASGLFPTLGPSGSAPQGKNASGGLPRTRPVANVLGNASVIGAQFAGLIALAIAFVLAVTRLSFRRR